MLIRAAARERPRPTQCHLGHDLDWLAPTVATCPCGEGACRWVWVLRGNTEVQWAGQLRADRSDAALALATTVARQREQMAQMAGRLAALEEQLARRRAGTPRAYRPPRLEAVS